MVTCLLTVLIWVFADQADRREVSVPVRLRLVPSPNSDLEARFIDPESGVVKVRVRGTNRALQRLGTSDPAGAIVVDWRLPAGSPVGRSTHELQPLLDGSPRFAGVVVADTYPRQATIEVDRYVVRELPIRVRSGTYAFVSEPVVDHPSVKVRILESAWREIPVEARQLQLSLDNHLKRKPQGQLLSFDVALPRLLAGHPITVEPENVNINLTLQERTSERKIAPVVVKFAVASELWGAYRPELRDPSQERLEIVVLGSEDALAQLAARNVLGIIDVTSDDISPQGEFRIKRPVFLLPPGIRLKGEAPQIEFRLAPVGE
jgi:hypothetical protein